jgi:hypothetical protein
MRRIIGMWVVVISGLLVLVLALAAISWKSIPAWQREPGGFLTLLGVALVAVVSFVGGSLSILKTVQELSEKIGKKERDKGKRLKETELKYKKTMAGLKSILDIQQREATMDRSPMVALEAMREYERKAALAKEIHDLEVAFLEED